MILRTSKPNRKGMKVDYYERVKDTASTVTVVKLYDTRIIIAENGYIKLNSGGVKTAHTKNVMNDFLPDGIKVKQVKGEWYVYHGGDMHDFVDDMVLDL